MSLVTKILASVLLVFLSSVTLAQTAQPSVAPLAAASPASAADVLAPYRAAALERWDTTIQQLETLDREETHPDSSILFIGSSSIRRWTTIAEDVAPYHPIRRGYGGSRFTDVAVFAERLVRPHRYQAMVVFVGNDIQGKPDNPTLDQLEPLVRHILDVSRQHQPAAPVLLIEITPTSSRFAAWPKIRQFNTRLRQIALTTPHVYFVPTAESYLHPATVQPRDELFVADKLHLNAAGYQLWGQILRHRLDEVLRLEATFASQLR